MRINKSTSAAGHLVYGLVGHLGHLVQVGEDALLPQHHQHTPVSRISGSLLEVHFTDFTRAGHATMFYLRDNANATTEYSFCDKKKYEKW